ncbi:ribosome rescue GTPase HflX [Methylomonas methanica]|uniref:GTPase HflX n=1 Tax=Methylomonas methanica (strain DSM 25384 / MC09) TaxID=857087 RepID=G0A0W9_METMM|nr:ribosome rescue GTPase HflX [Methylomonas methanica]AEG01225.1 GTP-binding proten HflX [Methylomonas methanica MC09]
MFERPEAGERAVLVHLNLQVGQEDLDELKELTKSAGAQPICVVTGSRHRPDPKYFVGKGKLDEIKTVVSEQQADIVIVNHPLSPSQERNLEKALEVRVVDRNGLILDIFAQRAQTFEGKLQVELAQLKHLSTRLIRGWTHLERQKGGIGLRGPGETQLETDRRLLAVRIKQIQQRLEKVQKQRHQGRSKRKKAEIPTVSLVGYTNAGKSTLFNTLTGADIYAADQLFATLDPTLRHLAIGDSGEVVLADTVGFIRHLPHELVAAFRSTLQEASEADLLLHVIDAHAEDRDDTIFQVNQVLDDIEAGKIPQLRVFNKIDLLDGVLPHIDYDDQGRPVNVWISAQSGAGCELLRQALSAFFASSKIIKKCFLPASQAGLKAKWFGLVRFIDETVNDRGDCELTIEIDKKNLGLLKDIRVEEVA